MNRIRVLVADDEEAVLEVLEAVIVSDPSLDLVAAVKDADTAIDVAQQEFPDVAVVDARMPGGGGVRAAREIRWRSPSTRVIALSAYEDRDTVLAMIRAGALSYVSKGADSTGEILRAIHRSTTGRASLSMNVVANVAEALAEHHAHGIRGSSRRGERMGRIQRTVDERAISMVFQPILHLKQADVVGVEALARFTGRPRRSPVAWFAEAAEVGMLVELEALALRAAFSELDRLPESLYMSVNVSPETIDSPVFTELVGELAAERVVIEITEHAPVEDYGRLAGRLGELREAGIRVAIDDAGAGFSSLRHVVRLTPDLIKLDLTLVHDIDSDPTRRALVSTLVRFASEIGAALVAEGIETKQQLDILRSIGVPFGQGFFLGRPGPMPRWGAGDPIWPGRQVFRDAAILGQATSGEVIPFARRSGTGGPDLT